MKRYVILALLVTLSLSLCAAVLWAGDTEITTPANMTAAKTSEELSLPGPAGHWECWDDSSLDPCHRDQVAIQALAEDDIWIGSGGNNAAGIRHFDGSEWSELTPYREAVVQHDLRDLSILSPTFGLAVGSHESWHWDGQYWHTVEVNHGWIYMYLAGVDVFATDDAWAAGYGLLPGKLYGSLAHWDGSGWTVVTATQVLNSVSMAGTSDAWAVGAGGAAYHWDGQQWVDKNWPGGQELFGVASLPGGKAWAVGASGTMAFYDGAAWQQESLTTTATLYDIVMPTADQGWVVGDSGIVLEYDGQDWTAMPVPHPVTLKAVDVLANGRVYVLGYDGELYTKVGDGAWTTLYEAPPRDWLYDVAMITPEDGWVVGNKGRCQHWDGVDWSPVALPFDPTLKGLHFLATDDGWGVGNGGAILHWDGGSWKTTTSITSTVLNDVTLISPTLGFAVGYGGAILKYDGQNWQESPSPTQLDLFAVALVSADDGWAVGGDYLGKYVDVILRWNGQEWSPFLPEDTFGGIFNDLAVINQDSVYASQSYGLYHFNGASWQKGEDPNGGTPSGVAMHSDQEGWAGSQGGAVSHWDGRDWEVVLNNVAHLDAISILSHDEAWAVTGANSGGAILHYTAPPQVSAGLSPGMVLGQTYSGHETSIKPIGASNTLTLTYKLRPREQESYLGMDHFFEVGASTTPFTAELSIVLELPEDFGAMIPFLGLYRLVNNQWDKAGITPKSASNEPTTTKVGNGITHMLAYEINAAGSYGLLLRMPENYLFLPAVTK